MDPYLKHTLFAIAAGWWITSVLILDFWPQVFLGIILAVAAKVLSSWEEMQTTKEAKVEDEE
jgi:hypothetical protein